MLNYELAMFAVISLVQEFHDAQKRAKNMDDLEEFVETNHCIRKATESTMEMFRFHFNQKIYILRSICRFSLSRTGTGVTTLSIK